MGLSCSHVLGMLLVKSATTRVLSPRIQEERNVMPRPNRSLPEPWDRFASCYAFPSLARHRDFSSSNRSPHHTNGRHARPLLPVTNGQWHCINRLATSPVEPMSPDLSPGATTYLQLPFLQIFSPAHVCCSVKCNPSYHRKST